MAKSDQIKDLRVYLTSRVRLHSFARQLDDLIKLAEESDEPDVEDDDSYGELIQVSPEELAAAEKTRKEEVEESLEKVQESTEDSVNHMDSFTEYLRGFSEEHAKYLIGDWNEGEFGMPPAPGPSVQKVLNFLGIWPNDSAGLFIRFNGFFEAKLDEKYPSIAREALNKIYTKSQMLGADAFFSIGLDERYPNSIKSFYRECLG